jgi:hypothetical protein
MGYLFSIISKEKDITKQDFDTALDNLSEFNKGGGIAGRLVCDVSLSSKRCISVSGSFSISGKYAEGFVLNLLICLIDLGYSPRVVSSDWSYGTKEDEEWLNNQTD